MPSLGIVYMQGYESLPAKETDFLLSPLIQLKKRLNITCLLAMPIACWTYWWRLRLGSSAVSTSLWGAKTMIVMRCCWRIRSTGGWCQVWSMRLLCRSGWGQRWLKDIGGVLSTGSIFSVTSCRVRSKWIRIRRWIKPWWGMLIGGEIIRRCTWWGEIEDNMLVGLIIWLGCSR